MHIARLFTNGRNQAVRIPKELEFQGINEVVVRKEGDKLIIEPNRKTWTSLHDAGVAEDDFMSDREDILDTGRVNF